MNVDTQHKDGTNVSSKNNENNSFGEIKSLKDCSDALRFIGHRIVVLANIGDTAVPQDIAHKFNSCGAHCYDLADDLNALLVEVKRS